MPKKSPGVYSAGSGRWYIKYDVGCDPVTGRRQQATKRGFSSAADAAKARRELVGKVDRGELLPGGRGTTVNQLLDLYLDGLDADEALAVKTRWDYRRYAAGLRSASSRRTTGAGCHARRDPGVAAQAHGGGRN